MGVKSFRGSFIKLLLPGGAMDIIKSREKTRVDVQRHSLDKEETLDKKFAELVPFVSWFSIFS